jgi:hypothetical protein
VTSIGKGAFSGCTSLTSVTIGASVKNIDMYALQSCSAITTINYLGTVSEWNEVTLSANWGDYTGEYTIYCTDGSIAKDGTVTYYN